MTSFIAVINAGSSSVKFAIYEATKEGRRHFRGQIEGIGVKLHLRIDDAEDRVVEDRPLPAEGFDRDAATRQILERLAER
jgi:acetate kinase